MLLKNLAALILVSVCFSALAQRIDWPTLPKKGFISGRTATQADVASGNAVFSTSAGNVVIPEPLKISIPQYAFHIVDGKRVPVIVVQAEEIHGKDLIGARELSGQELVGLRSEFELLGTVSPVAP